MLPTGVRGSRDVEILPAQTVPMPVVRRAVAAAVLCASVLPLGASPATAGVRAGHDAWVGVSVARLWQSPSSPRRVDDPALARPVRFRAWLSAMTLSQRRALGDLSDTEALLGERVRVTAVRGSWAHVVVPDQPSQKDSRGYPGWVPLRQLTGTTPPASDTVATVVRRTTWLRTDTGAADRVAEISFGTVLPVLGQGDGYVVVRTPFGADRRIRADAVDVHAPGTPALPRTRGNVVSTARSFTGLPYLWGGLSGFGLDCSGLTWLDYRTHGTRIPRDALPQSRHGTPVARTALRKGDLVFYATRGLVHHVTMYAGSGRMVEAPHTGAVVRTVPVRSTEYFSAHRYF
jgi:cell wall-associated NlpC family hydrolase